MLTRYYKQSWDWPSQFQRKQYRHTTGLRNRCDQLSLSMTNAQSRCLQQSYTESENFLTAGLPPRVDVDCAMMDRRFRPHSVCSYRLTPRLCIINPPASHLVKFNLTFPSGSRNHPSQATHPQAMEYATYCRTHPTPRQTKATPTASICLQIGGARRLQKGHFFSKSRPLLRQTATPGRRF